MKKFLFLCFFFSSSFGLYAQTCQNCGVNQATPLSSLHVTGCGSTNATSAFQVTNSSGKSMFFVQDDQKVGIGTKSLTYKLELSDTNTTSGTLDMFRMYNRYSATANNGAQMLFSANRTTSGITNVAGVSGLITDINATTYKGALVFSTANSAAPAERMRIDNVGNVGLGVTPTAHLHINHNFDTPGQVIYLNQPVATWGTIALYNSYRYIQTASLASDGPFRAFHVGAGGVAIGYDSTPVYGSNAALHVNGYVGIGTSTPQEKLQIGNSYLFHDGGHLVLGFKYKPSTATDLDATKYAAELRFDHVNGNLSLGTSPLITNVPLPRVTINKDGNVGIGTASPGVMLDVVKTGSNDPIVRFGSAGATDNQAMTIINGSGLVSLAMTGSTGSFTPGSAAGDAVIRYGSAKKLLISNGGSRTDMVIDGNGNVGLGTTTPASRLEVQGEFRTTINTPTPPVSGTGLSVSWNRSAGGAEVNFYNLYDNAPMSYLFSQKTGASTYTDLMTIRGTGVGIGTTAPNFKFDVNGAGSAGEIANFQNGTYQTIIVSKAAGAGTYNPITAANDNGIFWKDDTSIESSNGFVIAPWSATTSGIRIAGNGNVGIGTSNPTSLLHTVASGEKTSNYTVNHLSNTCSLAVINTGNCIKMGLNVQSTGAWTDAGNSDAVNVGLNVNATGGNYNYAALFSGGNVGIGTTTPATTLHIGGTTAAITTNEATSTPASPTAGSECRMYMKNDKIIIQYNDAGTIKYRYMDLTGTAATWTYTTTAP